MEKLNFEDLKYKALELLEPYETRYYPNLSDVHWVRQDEHDVCGDFCKDCISQAVKVARKELKESKLKVIAKFKEIKDTGKYNGKKIKGKYTDAQIKKSQRYELEKLGKSKFTSAYNYGGGYESDSFLTCNICYDELNISILPNTQNIEEVIEDLQDGTINDQTGYRAYCLIYNSWNETDEKRKNQTELTTILANRIIEILNTKQP